MLWKSFSGQAYWYKQILLFIMKDSKLNLDVSCLILFFISLIVFFNSPNFILETAICPVTSEQDSSAMCLVLGLWADCFLLSTAQGHCVIFPLSQLLEKFDLQEYPLSVIQGTCWAGAGDLGLEVGFRIKQSGLFCCVFGQETRPLSLTMPLWVIQPVVYII